jgi:hypothetical protein
MDSNRVRVAGIRETTLGVMPTSPLLRTAGITAEGLSIAPQFFVPNEIRADRMSADPSLINVMVGGNENFELAFIPDASFNSEVFRSAFFSSWTRGATWDNSDATFGAISAVATGALTVTDGSALANGFAASSVALGHLVRNTGFGVNANNGLFRASAAGSGTSIAFTAGSFTVEASPPAAARSKVVGFQGAAGDITATATGLASTALNFTTLGLQVGQWLKIGDGSSAVFGFTGTASNNGWARISGPITASAIPLDNLPTGWAADAGAGQTIRVFFGDTIRNGTTRTSLSVEKTFLSQATPTRIQYRGLTVDQLGLSFQTGQAILASASFMGTDYAQSTSAIGGAVYAAAPSAAKLTSNASVGRIAENGVAISTANWVRSLNITLANNVRRIEGVGKIGAYELGVGEIAVSGTLETYFSDNTLLTKLLGQTITNINARAQANNQALIVGLPRVTLTGGDPNAQGKNQDVTLPLSFVTSIDPTTGAEIIFDRFEYFN